MSARLAVPDVRPWSSGPVTGAALRTALPGDLRGAPRGPTADGTADVGAVRRGRHGGGGCGGGCSSGRNDGGASCSSAGAVQRVSPPGSIGPVSEQQPHPAAARDRLGGREPVGRTVRAREGERSPVGLGRLASQLERQQRSAAASPPGRRTGAASLAGGDQGLHHERGRVRIGAVPDHLPPPAVGLLHRVEPVQPRLERASLRRPTAVRPVIAAAVAFVSGPDEGCFVDRAGGRQVRPVRHPRTCRQPRGRTAGRAATRSSWGPASPRRATSAASA